MQAVTEPLPTVKLSFRRIEVVSSHDGWTSISYDPSARLMPNLATVCWLTVTGRALLPPIHSGWSQHSFWLMSPSSSESCHCITEMWDHGAAVE